MTFVYSHTRAVVRVAGTDQFTLSKAIAGPGALALRVSAVAIMAVGSVQPASAVEPLGQIFGYSVLSEVMRDEFATLPERLGIERFVAMTRGGSAAAASRPGVSARIDGVTRSIDANGRDTTNPISEHEWEHYRGEVAAGVDMPVPAGGGTVLLGASVHAVYSKAIVHAFSPGEADVDATGLGLGVGAAFFADGGFYVDLQGRVSIWDADVNFESERDSKSVDGLSGGLSLEAGSRIGLDGGLALTPRIQVTYTDVDFDRFTERTGVVVRQMDSDSLVLGAGVLVEFAMPERGVSVYGDLSASWDVLADSSIDASGLVVMTGLEDVWGKLAIGAAMQLREGASAYLQGDYGSALGELFRGSTSYGATAGISMDF